jgi:hypothetical protein
MANYPSDPGTGNRSTLIVFVVVLLILGCVGAGAAGAFLLFGGG